MILMEKKLTEILDVTADLFKIAKRTKKKHGQWSCVPLAVRALEDAAIENMCGTANVNCDEYIEAFYKGIITIDDLLQNLAYPLKKDAEEGFYNE
jgi:hypothetical protein